MCRPRNSSVENPWLGFRRRRRVLLAKFIDTPAGVHNFLLARVERMTVRANFHLQVLPDRRASLKLVTAGASDRDVFVFRMNAGFHRNLVSLSRQNRRVLYESKETRRHARCTLLLRVKETRQKQGRVMYLKSNTSTSRVR